MPLPGLIAPEPADEPNEEPVDEPAQDEPRGDLGVDETGLSLGGGGGFGCASTDVPSTSWAVLALAGLGLLRRRRRAPAALGVVAALVVSAGASAAERGDFAIERHRPAIDGDGIIDTEAATVGKHLDVDVALQGMFELNPLLVYETDAAGNAVREQALVGQRLGGNLVASVSLFDWMKLGVDLPLLAWQGRDDAALDDVIAGPRGSLGATGIGDLRVVPKVSLLQARSWGVDVAVMPSFTLPSGWPVASYMSDASPTFSPEIAVGRAFGAFRLAANGGMRLRPERVYLGTVVGSEVTAHVGAAARLHDLVSVPVELGVSAASAIGLGAASSAPLEVNAAASWDVMREVQVYGSAGGGLVRGLGTPDLRAIVGVRLSFENPACTCVELEPAAAPAAEPPPPAPAPVVEEPAPAAAVSETKIELNQRVMFETARDVIAPSSDALLDEVARVLVENPRIKKMRVDGHTDAAGKPSRNQALSERRAAAVVAYLVAHGVDAARLSSSGWGSQKPIASNDTEEGREQNRRVELTILEMGE
jgi:uncharacterized protein (TIGR03382 family)